MFYVMKNVVLNLGKALSKEEQQLIQGGKGDIKCTHDVDCPSHMVCAIFIGRPYGTCQANML